MLWLIVLLAPLADHDRSLPVASADVDSSSRKNAAKCCKVTETWKKNEHAQWQK
jgi:hypothetical protein